MSNAMLPPCSCFSLCLSLPCLQVILLQPSSSTADPQSPTTSAFNAAMEANLVAKLKQLVQVLHRGTRLIQPGP